MYSYEISVGYSTTDSALAMTVPAIMDCFQDAAIFEAENGGINMEYLYGRHLAWLLASWQIVIDRRPRLNDRITITTFPYDFKGFLGYRNFTLSSAEGEVLVKAASVWSLMNVEALRPERLDEEMLDYYKVHERLEMDYAPRKIALSGEGRAADVCRVRRAQIDSNHHMNNTEYVKLAMEYLPEKASVRELRVEYKKAAHLGDELTAVVHEAEGKRQIQLKNAEGESSAIVEFTLA